MKVEPWAIGLMGLTSILLWVNYQKTMYDTMKFSSILYILNRDRLLLLENQIKKIQKETVSEETQNHKKSINSLNNVD